MVTGCGDHPDLHSFPTRRSSDLARAASGCVRSAGKARATPLVARMAATTASAPSRLILRDRKSTRLNSSHSQISYAVFCLKKKTKPNTRLQDQEDVRRVAALPGG